jgi:hypothetical protein
MIRKLLLREKKSVRAEQVEDPCMERFCGGRFERGDSQSGKMRASLS